MSTTPPTVETLPRSDRAWAKPGSKSCRAAWAGMRPGAETPDARICTSPEVSGRSRRRTRRRRLRPGPRRRVRPARPRPRPALCPWSGSVKQIVEFGLLGDEERGLGIVRHLAGLREKGGRAQEAHGFLVFVQEQDAVDAVLADEASIAAIGVDVHRVEFDAWNHDFACGASRVGRRRAAGVVRRCRWAIRRRCL